jgi:hypothetical protein
MGGPFDYGVWSQFSSTRLRKWQLTAFDSSDAVSVMLIEVVKAVASDSITLCMWSGQMLPGPITPANRVCSTNAVNSRFIVKFNPRTALLNNGQPYFMTYLTAPASSGYVSYTASPVRLLLSGKPSSTVALNGTTTYAFFEVDRLLMPQTDVIELQLEILNDTYAGYDCIGLCNHRFFVLLAGDYTTPIGLLNWVELYTKTPKFTLPELATLLATTESTIRSQAVVFAVAGATGQLSFARLTAFAVKHIAPGQTFTNQFIDPQRWMFYRVQAPDVGAVAASSGGISLTVTTTTPTLQSNLEVLLGIQELPSFTSYTDSFRMINSTSHIAYVPVVAETVNFMCVTEALTMIELSIVLTQLYHLQDCIMGVDRWIFFCHGVSAPSRCRLPHDPHRHAVAPCQRHWPRQCNRGAAT